MLCLTIVGTHSAIFAFLFYVILFQHKIPFDWHKVPSIPANLSHLITLYWVKMVEEFDGRKKRHANWVGGSLNVCKEECCIASLALCAHRTETDVMAAFGRHEPPKIGGLRPPVPCARRPLAAAVCLPSPYGCYSVCFKNSVVCVLKYTLFL